MIELIAVALLRIQEADVHFSLGPERDPWRGRAGMTLGYVARHGPFRSSDGNGRLHLDLQPPGWPVALVVECGIAGLHPDLDKLSGAEVWLADEENDAQVADFDLGVRWTGSWPTLGPARPTIAGGPAIFFAELNGLVVGERVSRYDRSGAIGPWLEAGIFWELNEIWGLGARLRWDYARMDLFGGEGDVGGIHAGIAVEGRF